ncbi:MAG TPA: helix-turn-helix transcriptional regulator [Acholeplasmataceae bacterium]|nr:helix-turn-helix transcriptional regulator [Acholeplasmataceae bacterium]
MEKTKEIMNNIQENLIYYRAKIGLTQVELSEKLGYSNKSVSKWERGEGIPDVIVLSKIASIFGITVNDLISSQKVKVKKSLIKLRYLKAIFLAIIPWLIATLIFIILEIKDVSTFKPWLVFIYALPVSVVILTIFFIIWKNKLLQFIALSLLAWLIPLSIYLSLAKTKLWLIFLLGIPIQILLTIYFLVKKQKHL